MRLRAWTEGFASALESAVLAQALRFRFMKSVAPFALALALLAIGGLWLYSHLSPDSVGACHQIPASFGKQPTIRECQAYGASDFLVPLVVVAILLVVFSGDGDIAVTTPWISIRKKAKNAQKAVEGLRAETDLDLQGQNFVGTVSSGGSRPDGSAGDGY